MDIKYFKEQIHEELEGAKQYIEKAIEAKIDRPAWSRTFALMADAEAEHAGNLMKMMECYIRDMKKNNNANVISTPSSSTGTISATVSSLSMTEPAVSMTNSPESIYKNCMKEFGEVMTYVTNMKRGL